MFILFRFDFCKKYVQKFKTHRMVDLNAFNCNTMCNLPICKQLFIDIFVEKPTDTQMVKKLNDLSVSWFKSHDGEKHSN